MGDLSEWIGDRTRAGITAAFEVPGENDNDRRVGQVCAERELCVWVKLFKHRSLHKYTRVVRGQDGGEIKSMIDLVRVKKDMLRYVQDVRVVRGLGRDLSDHHVVLCKVRLVRGWIKRREVMVGARKVRSKKLREHWYREGYARSLEGKGIEWDGDNNIGHMFDRMDRVPNAQIRELCIVMKGVYERIDKGFLWCFDYVKRMENDRFAKSVCRRVCW